MDGGCYSDGLLVAVPTSLFLLEPLRHNPTLICYFTTSVSYSDVNNVFFYSALGTSFYEEFIDYI